MKKESLLVEFLITTIYFSVSLGDSNFQGCCVSHHFQRNKVFYYRGGEIDNKIDDKNASSNSESAEGDLVIGKVLFHHRIESTF